MAKLGRYFQGLFGSTASSGRISEFGSLQVGSPMAYSGGTVTPALIQGLSNFQQGWDGAVIANASPAIQDMNAVCYLYAYQLAYLMQEGVAEYDASTIYYINSLCQSNGVIFQSLIDSNTGNAPASNLGSDWQSYSPPGKNFLLNSNFDFSQRNSGTTSVAAGTSVYVADRWYIRNALNVNPVSALVTIVSPTLSGSVKALSAVNNGGNASGQLEVYQVLENADSIPFTNQNASFSIQAQGQHNVTQIGITFVYETSETKSSGANLIGTEVLFTVNSSTWTYCTISAQAMGSAFGTSGIVGVRIRPTAVSTGHVYDTLNGIYIAQAQMNLGNSPAPYRRNCTNIAEELKTCQRYFEKSYNVEDSITTITTSGCIEYLALTSASQFSIRFNTTKRVSNGTNDVLSTQTGTGGTAYDVTGASDVSLSIEIAGANGFGVFGSGLTANHLLRFHWEADAEI